MPGTLSAALPAYAARAGALYAFPGSEECMHIVSMIERMVSLAVQQLS